MEGDQRLGKKEIKEEIKKNTDQICLEGEEKDGGSA